MNKQLIREVKNEKGEIFREYSLRDEHSYNIGFNAGIEKGKLEQKKEELEFLLIMKEHIDTNNCPLPTLRLNDRIEQLRKEIGGMKE
jgi:hypothetical protein